MEIRADFTYPGEQPLITSIDVVGLVEPGEGAPRQHLAMNG